MKISSFQKNLKKLILYLGEKYLPKNKINSNLIYIHYLRINYTIRTILNIFFGVAFFVSRIIFFKHIYKLKSKQLKNVFRIILFFPVIGGKIKELICALIFLHYYNDEKINKKSLNVSSNKDYEFIVIGSGPGGSITANEIIKYSNNVMILEEGEDTKIPASKHPGSEFLEKWRDAGVNSSISGLQVNFSSGKTLGGGSEINSGLFHNIDEKFIDDWKQKYQTKNFDYNQMIKFDNEIKNFLNVSENQIFSNEVNSENFVIGSNKLNFKIEKIKKLKKIDKNKEVKLSMKNTYLKDYVKKGGNILTGSFVDYIEKVNDKWKIRVIRKKKIITFYCKYLFLCCGSLYTNEILLKSNIIQKRDQINFKFHPMVKIIADYGKKVQDLNCDVHQFQVTEFYPKYILGNASSSPQFLLNNFLDNKEKYEYIKKNYLNLSVYHATFSIGSGSIMNIFKKYKVLKYKIPDVELDNIKNALLNLSKILFEGGANSIILLKKGLPQLRKDNYINEINRINNIKDLKFSSVHILGGIGMGESKSSITNSFGRLKTSEKLYVNDSSLINNSLLKNPQGIIMSIALRNIRHFFEIDYKKNV